MGAIRAAVERLDKGFVVNIFPEGTRSEDGSVGPVAPGMSIILNRCKTEVPIVPVLIDGAYDAWPRNAKVPRARPIRIDYGKPIMPAEWKALSAEELAWRIRRELVGLQEQLGSVHAGESRRRLEEDWAKAAAQPVKRRRSR
jgi:1-acyl-sn-glycerol-3-phosphate acyltransferase